VTSAPPSTTSIPDLYVSGAGDPVLGLRFYGAEGQRLFPTEAWERLRIANDPNADVFINDPSITQRGPTGLGHASIRRHGGSLIVSDEGSKNGTFIDNERRSVFELKPGSVVRFGAVSMVAFSARTEAVRLRFMRLLGFGPTYLLNVEHAAFASIRRLHVIAHVPPGGFSTLVRVFHDTAPGATWPLYVVDDRIRDDIGAQRAILRRARLGTLVVPSEFWPRDASTIREALVAPTRDLRLILVAPRGRSAETWMGPALRDLAVSIDVPTLAERGAMEIDRAIHAGESEYGIPLGLSAPAFSRGELARLTSAKWKGNAEELEETVRRVTRVRVAKSLARAAEMEGIGDDALSHWMKRHKFPLRTPE